MDIRVAEAGFVDERRVKKKVMKSIKLIKDDQEKKIFIADKVRR